MLIIAAMMTLAQWLETNKVSQETFAVLVGVTQGRISQLLKGDEPSLKLARKIAAVTAGQVNYMAAQSEGAAP